MLTIFHTREEIKAYRHQLGDDLAFVPTMGALHQGHGSLISSANEHNPVTMASIFVNPLQFGNKKDLDTYPKTLETDIDILIKNGCRFLFHPSFDDLYSEEQDYPKFDISPLEGIYEGEMRPGHFDGVLKVLYTFFHLLQPNHVFFGQKDLQQCMVVEKLIAQCFPMIQMNISETVREESGLAMSSRNMRLSEQGKKDASQIFKNINGVIQNLGLGQDFSTAFGSTKETLASYNIEIEYLDLINLPNMDAAEKRIKGTRQAIVFAGFLEGVRLIDNVILRA